MNDKVYIATPTFAGEKFNKTEKSLRRFNKI